MMSWVHYSTGGADWCWLTGEFAASRLKSERGTGVTRARNCVQGLPQDELQALALCAGQVASEMEEPDAIADVRLLCTVAAAHEAMHAVLATKATAEKPAERPQRAAGVPRGVAAFVKELVPLSDQVARRGKILRCASRR